MSSDEDEDIIMLYLLYRRYRIMRDRPRPRLKPESPAVAAEAKQKKRSRRFSVHPINQQREKFGLMPLYRRLLGLDNVEEFYYYTRMRPDVFEELLTLISPDIQKQDTNFRKAIQPRERLFLTLRFLASGDTFRTLHFKCHIGISTILKIVYETCEAIWRRCRDTDMPTKLTKTDFLKVASEFDQRWGFPHCIGCLEGKLIRINYKNPLSPSKTKISLVLQAVVDANGNFMYVDVVDYEKFNDPVLGDECGFKSTAFGMSLMYNRLPLPDPEPIEGSDPLPYVFITPGNYMMAGSLLRQYQKRGLTDVSRNFNARLMHASKCVGLAFGSLLARWCVLRNTLSTDPKNTTKIIQACCVLHNFVRNRASLSDAEVNDDETEAVDFLPSVLRKTGRSSIPCMNVRNLFAEVLKDSPPPPPTPPPVSSTSTLASEGESVVEGDQKPNFFLPSVSPLEDQSQWEGQSQDSDGEVDQKPSLSDLCPPNSQCEEGEATEDQKPSIFHENLPLPKDSDGLDMDCEEEEQKQVDDDGAQESFVVPIKTENDSVMRVMF